MRVAMWNQLRVAQDSPEGVAWVSHRQHRRVFFNILASNARDRERKRVDGASECAPTAQRKT